MSQQLLRADEPTPYGRPVAEQVEQLGVLRCPLRYTDGKLGELRIRVEPPAEVRFRAAELLEPSCTPCFSELSFDAMLSVTSADPRLVISGTSILRELEPGEGYGFTLSGAELQIRGVLQTREPGLRVVHVVGEGEERLVAEAQVACTSE